MGVRRWSCPKHNRAPALPMSSMIRCTGRRAAFEFPRAASELGTGAIRMRVSGRMIKSKLSQYVHVIVHMIVHVAMGTRAVVGESSGSPPVLNAITVGMSTKIDLHIGISSILKELGERGVLALLRFAHPVRDCGCWYVIRRERQSFEVRNSPLYGSFDLDQTGDGTWSFTRGDEDSGFSTYHPPRLTYLCQKIMDGTLSMAEGTGHLLQPVERSVSPSVNEAPILECSPYADYGLVSGMYCFQNAASCAPYVIEVHPAIFRHL